MREDLRQGLVVLLPDWQDKRSITFLGVEEILVFVTSLQKSVHIPANRVERFTILPAVGLHVAADKDNCRLYETNHNDPLLFVLKIRVALLISPFSKMPKYFATYAFRNHAKTSESC